MVQDMTILLARGVFLLSVITILGSPPSATEQRYMCRNDLPWTSSFDKTDTTSGSRLETGMKAFRPHTTKNVLYDFWSPTQTSLSAVRARQRCQVFTYSVTPFCNLNNLLNIRISSKVGSREDQLPVNFNLQQVFNRKEFKKCSQSHSLRVDWGKEWRGLI